MRLGDVLLLVLLDVQHIVLLSVLVVVLLDVLLIVSMLVLNVLLDVPGDAPDVLLDVLLIVSMFVLDVPVAVPVHVQRLVPQAALQAAQNAALMFPAKVNVRQPAHWVAHLLAKVHVGGVAH